MSSSTTARELNRQIDREMSRLSKSIIDFSTKDRRNIVRKAAQPVARIARQNPGFDDSEKEHYRGKKPNRIEYRPGNLRRSIRVLPLKRGPDAFIGPLRARVKKKVYGAPGGAVDGYYAAALFGSQAKFRIKVLERALRKGAPAALRALRKESEKQFLARAVSRGFNVTR